MDAGDEFAIGSEDFEDLVADAGHDVHVDHNISGVGDFNADFGDVGADGTHGVGDDVHGSAVHAALVESSHFGFELDGVDPVVGRTGVFFFFGSDEGTGFNAGDVGRVTAEKDAVRAEFGVESGCESGFDEFVTETVILGVGAVAPVNGIRLAELGPFLDPSHEFCVVRGGVQFFCHE